MKKNIEQCNCGSTEFTVYQDFKNNCRINNKRELRIICAGEKQGITSIFCTECGKDYQPNNFTSITLNNHVKN
jgi:hypothetical protein